jgi:hypothetical protein
MLLHKGGRLGGQGRSMNPTRIDCLPIGARFRDCNGETWTLTRWHKSGCAVAVSDDGTEDYFAQCAEVVDLGPHAAEKR